MYGCSFPRALYRTPPIWYGMCPSLLYIHPCFLCHNCSSPLQVTCADLAIAVLLEALSNYNPQFLSPFSNLVKLKTSVEELPNIKKWMAARPETVH